MSRAVGETAPLIVIGAAGYVSSLPRRPSSPRCPFLSFAWLNGPTSPCCPCRCLTGRADPDPALSSQRRGRGPGADRLHALDERRRHRRPLSRPQEAQMVELRRSAMTTRSRACARRADLARDPRAGAVAAARTDYAAASALKAEVRGVSFFYGQRQALKNVNLPFPNAPSPPSSAPPAAARARCCAASTGCTTCIPATATKARSSCSPAASTSSARRSIRWKCGCGPGMVFQKPNPFPKSIFENVAYGLRLRFINKRSILDEQGRDRPSSAAALWDEVKDRLHQSAVKLSGGQQQRLCVARALATDPEILLLDEPTSALDPIATSKIEDMIFALKEQVTILIVTHNMEQAARVADFTAFMYLGELIEHGATSQIFQNPKNQLTEKYLTGSFG